MRRLWLYPALYLLLTFALHAQQLSITGRVVDSHTGRALPRATVSLAPLPGSGLLTTQPSILADRLSGPDGSFAFNGLAAGRYQLTGSRRGYRTASYGQHDSFFVAMIVSPGKPGLQGIQLALEPHASIFGTVLDSSGDPVEVASLSLFGRQDDGSGAIRLQASTFVQPGVAEYEFPDVTPGVYFVAVNGRPWFAQTGDAAGEAPNPLDVAYPLTFFDGAASQEAAQPVVVRAGDALELNFALRAVPSVHIRVATQPGGGFQFPQLSSPAFGDELPVLLGTIARGRRDGDGSTPGFNLSVAPGTYTLQRGGSSQEVVAGADVTLAADDDPEPATVVTGRVAMADGAALPTGLMVHLVQNGGSNPGFAGRFGRGRQPSLRRRSPRSDLEAPAGANGIFQLSAPPGDYHLTASASGAAGTVAVVATAASGGTVSNEQVLQVKGDPVTLAAMLAPADGTVSGTVVDARGQTESGVMVVLAPKDGAALALYRQDESDSDGSWHIAGVAAGQYRVVAIEDGWDLVWKQPEVLAKYQASGGVRVTPDGRNTLALPTPLVAQTR